MSKRPYTRLSMKDMIRVHEKLKAVLKEDGDRWAYLDGYSDEKVAKELGFTMPPVRNVRRKSFGDLRLPNGASSRSDRMATITKKLAAIEDRLKLCEDVLDELTSRRQAAE